MKYIKWSFIFFVIYAALAYWYIFIYADTSIPDDLMGTMADPAMFMDQTMLKESSRYMSFRNFLYLLEIPFEFLVLFLILVLGIAKRFDHWAQQISKFSIVQAAVFTFYFSILAFIVDLPFSLCSYWINRMFGISVASFHSFMKEAWLDFWISGLMMFVLVFIVYWLMQKSVKRWWLYAWLLSIPFTLFVVFIQPVLIDPLYQTFSEIENKQLEAKILELAKTSNIPADQVYQVEMSDETKAMNAYVTGIGSNTRIVLWDTTLNGLTENEILFIMAHEMSHYIHKDIYQNIVVELILSFFSFGLCGYIIRKLEKKHIYQNGKRVWRSFAVWPLILLITSIVSFAATPITNWVSRQDERICDTYAVKITKNPQAGIQTFQQLARNSLAEVNPPNLIKWLRYDHPPLMERLEMLDKLNKKQEN